MELNINAGQGMFLCGRPGLSMKADALSFASRYLGTEHLSVHPDFLLIEPPPEKKTIGVDAALTIVSKGALRPALAKKQVIIINGIDTMTEEAQNKILKLLEDVPSVLVIAISYGGSVLDTVKSRLTTYVYHPLGYDEFEAELEGSAFHESTAIYYHLTGGCPGLCEELSDDLTMFKSIVSVIEHGNLVELLPTLHLLVEKDKKSIAGSPYLPNILRLMEACFSAELEFLTTGKKSSLLIPSDIYSMDGLLRRILLLDEHRAICKRTTYSKDDLFLLIVNIIEA